MRSRSTYMLFILSVIILPLGVYGIVSWWQSRHQALTVYNEGVPVPSFSFMNQSGNQVTDAGWKNKIVVADFFFTHCTSVCPKMTKSLLDVQEIFQDDEEVIINSFSVDPEHDTVGRLRVYATEFGIKWDLLTGNKKEIYKLARNGFKLVATDGDGGPQDFIHSEKLVLIDKQKRIRGYYNGTVEKEVEQLVRDIKKLKHEK